MDEETFCQALAFWCQLPKSFMISGALMDVSYLICDAFGSWIILIDSAVQKLRLNMHQAALVLSRRQTRPEHTVALCVRRQLTIAEMAGMPPLKSGIQGELSGHIFLLPSVAQMFLRAVGHSHWEHQQPPPAYNVVVYAQSLCIQPFILWAHCVQQILCKAAAVFFIMQMHMCVYCMGVAKHSSRSTDTCVKKRLW